MPSHARCSSNPRSVKTLADHPNIIGLKDSSANMTWHFRRCSTYLGDHEVISPSAGKSRRLTGGVVDGADGGVNGGANIFL